jgi:hypothetical protein
MIAPEMRITPPWTVAASLPGQLLSPRIETTHERWRAQIRSGNKLVDLITRRLLAKKFRKSPLDARLISRVTRTVSHCLNTDAPLRIFVPFGGYKSPASPEFPWAGWAELFAVAGLAAVVAPICEFHPAGAVVEFSSDELIVPRLTGAPRPVLDRYRADFDRILALARPYLPPNLRLHQSFLRDAYDEAELTGMISGLGRHLAERWFPGLPPDQRERLLRSAANNRFRVAGTHVPAGELRRTVCEHQAFLQVDEQCRAAVFADRCTIPVALRRGLPGWLHLGSNHRSATQFWIGFGVVDTLPRSPAAHILPPGRAAAVLPRVTYIPAPMTDVRGLTHMPVTAGIPR